MDTEKIQYDQGLVTIPLDNGQSLKLTPQECWRVSEEARSFLFENYYKLDPIPTRVIEKNGRGFKVAITDHVPFWRKVDKGRWEPHTFKIFDDFLTTDCVFLDVGAWIGPTALYAAHTAKQVHAFEPDPLAFWELEVNVNANRDSDWGSRINIHNNAVAASAGTIKLGSRKWGGDSMSSVLFADRDTSWEIQALTLKQFIEDNNLQDEKLFIKVDIEGGEYGLIPSLKELFAQYDIQLYLSLHPFFLPESQALEQGSSLFKRISQRFAFVQQQVNVLRALPFKYLYHQDGRPVSRAREVLQALLLGDLTHEIIATDSKWQAGG